MIKNISNLGDAALYCDFGKEVDKDINTNVNRENFCLVLFFKKAERIAIIKSSLLVAITFNIQST